MKVESKPTNKMQKDEVLSDNEIVRRVQAGETPLFELLFRRHSQRVYRVARTIVRDDAEAADLVQEAYLRAHNHLDQFAGRSKFSTWLTRIAVYLARDRARRQGKREATNVVPTGEAVAPGADPERRAFGQEVKAILEAAIDALPGGYRTVFVMREIEEMSTAETAECLNLNRDTVKTRLHRARILLQEKLYESVGSNGADAFRFAGARCERMIATLLAVRRRARNVDRGKGA